MARTTPVVRMVSCPDVLGKRRMVGVVRDPRPGGHLYCMHCSCDLDVPTWLTSQHIPLHEGDL